MSVLDEIVIARKKLMNSLPTISPSRKYNGDFMAIFKNFSVIAECKWRSPAEGFLVEHYDPVAIAKQYVAGGADAISVLTEPYFFHGSFMHLEAVTDCVNVPVLCKDVVVDERQVYFANLCGASACLLMVACLDGQRLQALYDCIVACQMTPVVEVFNETEIHRALQLNPQVIQINNRNLKTMATDVTNSEQLCAVIPRQVKVIAASGVTSAESIAGYSARIDAVLIGTALMRSQDPCVMIKNIKQVRA